MIVKEATKGSHTTGLLAYLYGPGKGEERGGTVHIDPRTVASWDGMPSVHVPVQRSGGGQSVREMARTIDLPSRLAGRSTTKRTGHIVVANHHDDPVLSDAQWSEVAQTTMRNAGLWNGPDDDAGVRWIATRHDDNSIHITFSRVREDGRDVGYINYTRAWEDMRHEFENRWELTPTGKADGTSRRPYDQAEASRAKAERHRPGGDQQALPDTAQLRHWCTVIALEAESEDVFVSRLRAAGVTVIEQRDAAGQVTDYRVGMRTDSNGSPVLYNLGKLAPELNLDRLRSTWDGTADDSSERSAEAAAAVAALERAAASAPEETTDDELVSIGIATREVLHAAAEYADLGELRAAAEAADRAGRLAGSSPWIPSIAGGPAAQMARDLRVSAGILLRARPDDEENPDRDTVVRLVIAVASVLVQVEAWHELADRRAAAHAALTARQHVLEARRVLTSGFRPDSTPPVTPQPGRAGVDYSAARATTARPTTPPPDVPRRR